MVIYNLEIRDFLILISNSYDFKIGKDKENWLLKVSIMFRLLKLHCQEGRRTCIHWLHSIFHSAHNRAAIVLSQASSASLSPLWASPHVEKGKWTLVRPKVKEMRQEMAVPVYTWSYNSHSCYCEKILRNGPTTNFLGTVLECVWKSSSGLFIIEFLANRYRYFYMHEKVVCGLKKTGNEKCKNSKCLKEQK